MPAAAPAAPVASAAPEASADAQSGPASADGALMAFLEDTPGLEEIKEKLLKISWDDCDELFKEGRPKLMSRLKKEGLTLGEQQRFASAFGKATKPDIKVGQPGGGRPQPEPHSLPKVELPGVPAKDLANNVQEYQKAILRDLMPPRKAGLFPPSALHINASNWRRAQRRDARISRLRDEKDISARARCRLVNVPQLPGACAADDELMALIDQMGWKPCTKGLMHPTADGDFVFATVENGWCSGENACEHGMDLRWFIKEGFADQTLLAAVRFSEYAQVGRGHGTSVHGGGVESALDEATAELCKSKVCAHAEACRALSRPH
eukprot:5560829-Prymnesium_polylepis.1